MAKKKEKKKNKKILPGGLTHVQNEFLKHQLKNNPEFVAKYFPNVILRPPSGPLYNVDLPKLTFGLFGYNPPKGTPVKAIYETAEPKKPGPFDYMELEAPTKGAQFTAENVPYDTPNSVLDIQPSDHDESYAYTIPGHMNQDLGTYFIKGEGGPDDRGQFSEPKSIPITKGQSSTIYLNPEMIKDYGTDPKAPRNEMVPTPEWWPDKKATHVDQAEINKFIKDVMSHEVSHNVSALPEHEGIVSQADEIDFTELFPQFSSKEAQDAIEQLNILNKLGGAVHSRDYKTEGPDYIHQYPPPSAHELGMGWRTISPELVQKEYIKGAKDRELESEYESTLIEYGVNEEELYNRAKDIYKVKMKFPDTYKDTMMYKNNMNFIEEVLEGMPKNVFGKTGSKAEIYLKKIEPQVRAYFTQMEKQHPHKDFASGGIAGLLGEPRSGYNEGKEAKKKGPWYLWPYRRGKEWDKILEGIFKDKEIDPEDYKINVADGGRIGLEGGGVGAGTDRWDLVKKLYKKYKETGGTKTIEEFGSDVLFQIDRQEGPYFREGGRIGLAEGMTPSESWMRDYFYSGKGGYDDSGMTFDFFQKNIGPELWYKHIGKAKGGRIGYDGGGPINLQALIELYMSEGMTHDEAVAAANKPLPFHILTDDKAEGGRIGFKEGEGIMSRVGDMVDVRNVPYYSGKALQGLVNSAETLSKFPLAAGELGSKLIQQPPKKEMFMEAIEDITPGSWSENLGLTSLVEGMGEKRPKDAQTVGGILGLGTEIAVPTGGAFKAGQFLLSKASKLMGKVKDGKTLNKLIEDKISDSGQSRRDFMSLVGASGLAAGLKWLGLGGVLKGATKKLDDIEIQVRGDADYEYVDEGWEGGTWANVYFNALTKKGQKILEKLTKGKDSALTYQDGLFVPGNSEEAAMVVQKIISGHKPNWRLNTATTQVYNPATKSFAHPKGSVKEAYETTKNYSGKDLNKKTIMKEADDLIASELSPYHTGIEVHDEYFDDILDQITTKKAEGGRIGLDAGGLAGMLGERTGFPQGKRVTKKPKKPKKTMTIKEAIADINKKLKAPDITDDESRRLRIIMIDLILGPGMGGPRGDKIYQSEEDLPEGILELLQKDPAFDFEEFSEIEWSPEGLRWTDKGHPGAGKRGEAGGYPGGGAWSGMAPFGETVYQDEGRGPRNRNIHMTDLDKAKVISHELRHNLMGDEGSPLHYTQPEWVKKYEGRNYLRSKDNKPIGTSGHELYNRFIDSRLFPGEKDPGPNSPYFDKILRDYWEPNFQQYKKGVKELKSKPEHLSAEGGRIGLGTGGPPIEPIKLGPLQLKPRASASFTTGQPYGPNLREKTWTDQIGIGGMLDLPGGFSLTGDYDKFRTKDRLYDADSKFIDERVRGDHDAWNIGLNWKKSFADGGLTKTIPPERGPDPQGLPSALYNGIMRPRSY